MTEYMAMDATRAYNLRIAPKAGDSLVTNRRRPILVLEEDTAPGAHDTLMAACDRWRYGLLGVEGYHDNCADNLARALDELGVAATHTPAPLNLFMNIPWREDGRLSFEAPVTRPGDHVVLRAGVRLHRRDVGVPAGHPPDQRRGGNADGGAFRGVLSAPSRMVPLFEGIARSAIGLRLGGRRVPLAVRAGESTLAPLRRGRAPQGPARRRRADVARRIGERASGVDR